MVQVLIAADALYGSSTSSFSMSGPPQSRRFDVPLTPQPGQLADLAGHTL